MLASISGATTKFQKASAVKLIAGTLSRQAIREIKNKTSTKFVEFNEDHSWSLTIKANDLKRQKFLIETSITS